MNDDAPLLQKVRLAVRVLRMPRLSMLARVAVVDLLLGYHNSETGQCNPKIETMAKRLGRDRKRVQLALEEAASVKVVAKKRRRGASQYRFPSLDGAKTPYLDGTETPSQDRAETPSQDRAKAPTLNTRNQTQEPEPNICEPDLADFVEVEDQAAPAEMLSDTQLETEFGRFWDQCTRRSAKGEVRRQYFKIVRQGKATPAELLRAMMIYAAARAEADKRFTKTPARWLEQECWHDDPEAIAPVGKQQPGWASYAVQHARAAGEHSDWRARQDRKFAAFDKLATRVAADERGEEAAHAQASPPREDERWLRVKAALKAELPAPEFNAYFAGTVFEKFGYRDGAPDGSVILRANAPIDARTIKQKYEPRLVELWRKEEPTISSIEVRDKYGELVQVPVLRTGT